MLTFPGAAAATTSFTTLLERELQHRRPRPIATATHHLRRTSADDDHRRSARPPGSRTAGTARGRGTATPGRSLIGAERPSAPTEPTVPSSADEPQTTHGSPDRPGRRAGHASATAPRCGLSVMIRRPRGTGTRRRRGARSARGRARAGPASCPASGTRAPGRPRRRAAGVGVAVEREPVEHAAAGERVVARAAQARSRAARAVRSGRVPTSSLGTGYGPGDVGTRSGGVSVDRDRVGSGRGPSRARTGSGLAGRARPRAPSPAGRCRDARQQRSPTAPTGPPAPSGRRCRSSGDALDRQVVGRAQHRRDLADHQIAATTARAPARPGGRSSAGGRSVAARGPSARNSGDEVSARRASSRRAAATGWRPRGPRRTPRRCRRG